MQDLSKKEREDSFGAYKTLSCKSAQEPIKHASEKTSSPMKNALIIKRSQMLWTSAMTGLQVAGGRQMLRKVFPAA